MPMLIAKNHSDKISQLTNFRKYDNAEIKTGTNIAQTSIGQISKSIPTSSIEKLSLNKLSTDSQSKLALYSKND